MAELKAKFLDERGRIIAPGIERPDDMTPISVRLPEIAALRDLESGELLELAQRYGVYPGWRDLWAQNAAYVERFSKIPPGSPEFLAEVQRITDPLSSRRAALGMARHGQRSYNQLLATDGDATQLLVRVGEGDDAMCEGCQALEGAEGTYEEHDAIGMPGTQECGQNCRCVLLPVDARPSMFDAILVGAAAVTAIDMVLGNDND